MRTRSLVALFLLSLSAAFVGGCGLQPGTTTISFEGGKLAPPPLEAAESGTYVLFASNSGNALYTIGLKQGDPYGFRKASDGSIEAFAKNTEIPLQNWLATSYFWKHQSK